MLSFVAKLLNKANARSFVSLTQLNELEAPGIAMLKLERPEAINAFSLAMMDAFERKLSVAQSDESMRCLLISSVDAKFFCAGADLKERLEMTVDEVSRTVYRLQSLFDAVARLPVPTIAIITGPAFGGGAELALACDIRLGSPKAVLAFPETRLAILPGAGGTQRLPRLIGPSKAKELIFTGRRVSRKRSCSDLPRSPSLCGTEAEECLSLGLLNSLSETPVEDAYQMGCDIAKGGPIGVRSAKQAIDDGIRRDIAAGLQIESECYAQTLRTQDRLEGLRAFQEKRPPHYQGR